MTEINAALAGFIKNVKQHQTLWGLMDETGEGWVVCSIMLGLEGMKG